jgi:hypothetical protein
MATGESTWDRVDLPVLRFVETFPYHLGWKFERKGSTEELPSSAARNSTRLCAALKAMG